MFKGKKSKGIALLLTAVMATAMFTGCGKREESSVPALPQGDKGRYVEKEIPMPEGVDAANIVQIFKEEGKLHMLVRDDSSGSAAWQDWEYSDGSFTEVTQQWLKELDVPNQGFMQNKLLKDQNGASYLFAVYIEEGTQEYKGHLWKSEDGVSTVEITPEKWKTPNEEFNYYESPEDLVLLDNGMLVAVFYNRTEYYLSEDGSLVKEIEQDPMQQRYVASLAASGDRYYLMASDEAGMVTGIESFKTDSDSPQANVPYAQESTGSIYMDVLEDGTLLTGSSDGFFRCKEGSTNWEKLIEGLDTSMCMLDMWARGMKAMEDGSFYMFYGGENGKAALMQYVFDPEAVAEVTQTLNVYSVTESFMLQQAAALFHRKHPEVMVKIETAVSYVDQYRTTDYSQIYQELNTKLTAGEGPDILVMDHLDYDTFTEKGLLADINDVVGTLEQDGKLLANVTGSFLQEDGKRYVIPLQFSLVLGIGRDVDVSQMADIPSLAKALSETEESLMGPRTPSELVEAFLPYFSADIIKGKELDKEALKTNLEYLKTIGENCGIIANRGEDDRAWNIWDIASRAKLCFYEAEGFNQSMMPISAADLVNGSFVPFGNAFYPVLQTGIYAKTEQMELAKEFLAFLLSDEIQNQDHYEGFPVNSAALDEVAAQDRSNIEAFTMIEMADGAEGEFNIHDFEPEDAKLLTDACRSVNKIAQKDDLVLSVIADNIPGYLDGTQTIEKTIEGIEKGLRNYLAE